MTNIAGPKKVLFLLLTVALSAASIPARFTVASAGQVESVRGSSLRQHRTNTLFFGTCDDDVWTTLPIPSLPFFPMTNRVAISAGTKIIVWGTSDQFASGYVFDLESGALNQVSSVGQPVPQTFFTAVWTGRIMIVWGGTVSGGQVIPSGGSYNPVSDTWTPITLAGSPTAPGTYAAVWTGLDMVVFGSGGGGRYDPSADAWTQVNLNFAPQFSANKPATAVWTGTDAIFWGSQFAESTKTYLPLGGQYNEASNLWQPVSSTGAPAGTNGLQAVWTGNSMIVWNNDGDPGIWDSSSNTWSSLPAMNPPQGQNITSAESVVWTGSEMVVWGQANTNLGARYDPDTKVWRSMSTVNAPPPGGYVGAWTGQQLLVLGPETNAAPGTPPNYFGSVYCANAPAPCNVTLSSSSQTFGAAGGNGTVSLTTSTSTCPWNATADSSWITLQNSSGSGNGALNYTVASNTGSGSRMGHISISGQTFTVNQVAGPRITGVSADGKNVIVTGLNFDAEAIVLVNSAPVKQTLHDPQNPNALTGKKGLKGIRSGRTVAVQVQNSDGALSDPFAFVRP